MSSLEEFVEQVVVEEVSAETIETVEILNGFGLSAATIECFIANEYTAETLRIIERREVEELIQVPFLAERTKFIHGLNTWRKAQGLPTLAEQIVPLQSISAAVESKVARQGCTATYLLGSSPKGQVIIQKYQNEHFLSRSDKKVITHIVVDEFKDIFSKLTPAELLDRAIELHKLFPSEPQEIWYQPTWTKDSTGKRIKLRKQAKGRLYDRNVNYKEASKDESIQPSSSHHQKSEGGNLFTDQQVADFQQTKNWITHNQDEWDEIKHKWRITCAQRIYELSKLENRTASLILSEYPVFRNHQGYQLVQIDFQHQFPDKEKLLFDRWTGFLNGIRHILHVEVSDTEGKALLELLDAEDVSADGQSLISVWLLAHILPSPLLICSGKRRWKPSILESRDSIAVLVKDLSELQATLAKLFDVWREHEIASAPFIVVHGEDLKNPTGFTVWNNVVSYKLPSFQKALDICLKIYKSYALDFPRQTASVWHLLACYLYDFSPPGEQANIVALIAAIRAKASSQ